MSCLASAEEAQKAAEQILAEFIELAENLAAPTAINED